MPERFWILVKDGVVINSVLWDGADAWTPPEDCLIIETTNMETPPAIGEFYHVEASTLLPSVLSQGSDVEPIDEE